MDLCYSIFLLSTVFWLSTVMVEGLRFNSTYTVTVTETPASDADTDPTPPAPVSGVVLTTTCTHSNATPVADPSDLRYSILEGDPALFSIGESSGEFSVAEQPFDYEEQPWYLVYLLCYLDSDPSSNGTGVVNVTIGPVNEYLPAISSSSILNIVVLSEDEPVGKVIASLAPNNAPFQFSATDRDDGPDGRMLFDLTQEDSSHAQQNFDINPDTGTLTLKQALDVDDLPADTMFETLDLFITACNEGISTSICNNILLVVFVTQADDNDPRFLQPQYNTSLQESSPNGTLVIQVTCEDGDKGTGSFESITFESGTPDSVLEVFEVNSTGAVLLKRELDYENTTGYQFQLVCSDGNTTATTQVTVTVLPVRTLRFTEDYYEFSVERTALTGHTVGQVEATYSDMSTGNSVVYAIETNSNFAIDTDTGEITIKDFILAIEGSSFDVKVYASDGDRSDNATVLIRVTGPLSVVGIAVVSVSIVLQFALIAIVTCCCCYCCIWKSNLRKKKVLTTQTVYSQYDDLSSPDNVVMDEFQGGVEPGGEGEEGSFPQ